MGFFMDFSLHSPLAGSSASLGAAAPGIYDQVYPFGDVLPTNHPFGTGKKRHHSPNATTPGVRDQT